MAARDLMLNEATAPEKRAAVRTTRIWIGAEICRRCQHKRVPDIASVLKDALTDLSA